MKMSQTKGAMTQRNCASGLPTRWSVVGERSFVSAGLKSVYMNEVMSPDSIIERRIELSHERSLMPERMSEPTCALNRKRSAITNRLPKIMMCGMEPSGTGNP